MRVGCGIVGLPGCPTWPENTSRVGRCTRSTNRGAEYVPGGKKAHAEAPPDPALVPEGDGHEPRERGLRVRTRVEAQRRAVPGEAAPVGELGVLLLQDRKSTRLNSSP